MANINRPLGFIPVEMLDGSKIPTKDFLVNAVTTDIGVGDMVIKVAGGGIDDAAAGAGLLAVGVVEALYDTNHNPIGGHNSLIATKYLAAGDSGIATVALALHNAVFRIQSDGNTAAADVWQLADHLATTVNTVTGRSAQELNATSQVSAIAQLQIIGKVEEPGNDWGDNVDLLVTFVESTWVGNATVVGV